ncbi:Acetyl-CoA biotin carboxyl carrier [Bythopirellula polymerisocia]|uniref:Biotin carboxyl carrier protein of acetyl-CoA carboxylase n=2 Tax=Bythopirellula polymerisocia TaxID=2528003 RepID=A0A5C6CNL5_9BACT|nr:Acetyl-CoA biotin carboxyl carrier [Bythopirellula polymerisocia]
MAGRSGKRTHKKDSGRRDMTNGGSGDVFDVRKVRRLVELMNEHELAEVDLRQGDQRIRLRRGQEPVVTMGGAPVPMAPAPAPAVAPPATAVAPAAAAEEANVAFVTSPMVGTFYLASSPESPPLVSVGDSVGSDTIVCIIEAMKVFNEIPAECSGKILARLVENGDPVEYGQKLFKVHRG